MRVSAMAKGVSTDYDPSPPPSPKPTHNYYSIQIIIQASSAHPKPTNTIRLRICGSASTTRQSYCGCQQEEQLRLGNPHSKMAEPYRTQQIRERGGGEWNQISKGGEHSTTKGGLSPASPPKQNYQADHHQRTIHHLRRCQLPPPPVRIIVFANANDARANEALFPSIQHWTRQICEQGGGGRAAFPRVLENATKKRDGGREQLQQQYCVARV